MPHQVVPDVWRTLSQEEDRAQKMRGHLATRRPGPTSVSSIPELYIKVAEQLVKWLGSRSRRWENAHIMAREGDLWIYFHRVRDLLDIHM